MSETQPKFCKDCKWFRDWIVGDDTRCENPNNVRSKFVDLIRGATHLELYEKNISTVRNHPDRCGREARWFEAKPDPLLEAQMRAYRSQQNIFGQKVEDVGE